jgi:hypothetical protein
VRGRAKVEAALSTDGTPEIPAVICYEGIFVRDHWRQLTDHPWWYREAPDLERQVAWRRDVAGAVGQDWFSLPVGPSLNERKRLSIDVRPEGVFRVDRSTGSVDELKEPPVGGMSSSGRPLSFRPAHLADTVEQIDVLVPAPPMTAPDRTRGDLATDLLNEFGEDLYPIAYASSPLWNCYSLWGFEGMMTMVAERPDLVEHACRRFLALELYSIRESASMGAAGVWIEDCMTDMVSPAAFEALNVRFLRSLVDEIRAAGMHSVYYFCGNPKGKWEHLLSLGVDALALEESKKGFRIDIEDVVDVVRGRVALLGNIDAIRVLQDGSEEELTQEIARQIAAGRRNEDRFIMSIGSPVTPATPVGRIRRYCDLVRQMGSIVAH